MYRRALRYRRRLVVKCNNSASASCGGGPCRSPELLSSVRINAPEASAIARYLDESDDDRATLPRPVAVSDTSSSFGAGGWFRLPLANNARKGGGEGDKDGGACGSGPPASSGGVCAYFDQSAGGCRLAAASVTATASVSSRGDANNGPNDDDDDDTDLRPTPCRTFPLWPDGLASEFDWFRRYPALTRGEIDTISIDPDEDAADDTGEKRKDNDVITVSAAELAVILTHHCAYQTGEINEFTYAEARHLISQLPREDLDAVVSDLEMTHSRVVLYQDEEVTVMEGTCDAPPSETTGVEDEKEGDGDEKWRVRCLYFNDRPGLVQSSVYLRPLPSSGEGEGDGNKNGVVSYELAPDVPSPGDHHQGLALSLALYLGRQASAQSPAPADKVPTAGAAAPRILVLGAGACALPLHLRSALPYADIVAVEISGAVCRVARSLFGATAIMGDEDEGQQGRRGSFELIQADAREFISGAASGSFDVIVVDLEDGTSRREGRGADGAPVGSLVDLVAPPAWVLGTGVTDADADAAAVDFMSHTSRVLVPGGVVAINVVGDHRGRRRVASELRKYFPDVFGCNAPNSGENGVESTTREGAVFGCRAWARSAVAADADADADAAPFSSSGGASQQGARDADLYREQLWRGMGVLASLQDGKKKGNRKMPGAALLVDDAAGWIDERLVLLADER